MWIKSMLATCNERKSSKHAVSGGGLFATMKAQQAVAIRFVGRRARTLGVPFFYVRHGLFEAFTSLRDMSLPCNGCAVEAFDRALLRSQ